MIKISFYQLFESKEVKYLQSNKGGAEKTPLENYVRYLDKKIFHRLVNKIRENNKKNC